LSKGVADTLAALLAFPGCVVLGASGWHHMEAIAVAVARRVVQRAAAGSWWACTTTSRASAARCVRCRPPSPAGLVLDESIDTIDIGAHKDLADAWHAGWRWEMA